MKLRIALFLTFALALAGCGGGDSDSGGGDTIVADGSSTVGPYVSAAAERYQDATDARVTVGISGTGGGFERFCRGETDLSNASRPMKNSEAILCRDAGVKWVAFTVANDGLSVVVSPENDWAQCLTVDQLKTIWDKDSKVSSWSQVDPSFPDEELVLNGPGTDSGTFDYFTEQINGEEGRSRSDYNATEDDNVIVQGVAGEKGGLGYFGLSYLEQNSGELKGLEIDGGDGCVAPSTETVQDGTYEPLSRPLFIYVSATSLKQPAVEAFVEHYLENAATLAEQALFVPLTPEQQNEAASELEALTSAT